MPVSASNNSKEMRNLVSTLEFFDEDRLTLEFFDEDTLAAAPLGVQSDGDGLGVRVRVWVRLTLKFFDEYTLAAAPLGVQSDGDGSSQGRVAQYVGDRTAVQVVTLDRLLRIQVAWKKDRNNSMYCRGEFPR